jgi:hypothetical protein
MRADHGGREVYPCGSALLDQFGDLLLDRCDVLATGLEIRLGPVINLTRSEIVGNQRFLVLIVALIISG